MAGRGRDLKPDNILVGEFGETQVVDWGLARRHEEELPDASWEQAAIDGSVNTVFGSVLGTPMYMSPEQAEGLPAEPRSDVFSLGVVLYEIIAGAPPLHGLEPEAILGKLRKGELPPLAERQPEAPAELVAIVARALAMEPARRYPDARALAADVERFLDGRRVAAHRYSLWDGLLLWARAWRAPLTVAGVAAVLLLLLALWAVWRTGRERDAALAAEARTRRALLDSDRNLARALVEQALAAYAADAQPEAELLAGRALRLTDSAEARGVLAAFTRVARPALRERAELPPCQVARAHPDGRLLCVGDGTLAVWSGHPLRKLWEQPVRARDAMWMDGGRRIAVSQDGHRALVYDAAGTRLGEPTNRLLGPGGWIATGASPLAVLLNMNGLSVLDGRTLSVTNLSPCGSGGPHLAAAIDDRRAILAAACKDGSVVLLAPDGPILRRIPTPFSGEGAGASGLSLSPDGTTALVASLDGEIALLSLQSSSVRLVRRLNNGILRSLVYSPDGRVVLLLGDRGGATLWQPDPGSVLRRLPALGDHSAVWSADGTELITLGTERRRWSVPASLPPLHPIEQRLPGLAGAALSPAGDRLAVARGDGSLEVIDPVTGRLLFRDRFQDGVLKGVSFSPDGKSMLAWAAGRPSLRSYDAAGRVLATYDYYPVRRAALLPSGWLLTLVYTSGARLYDLRTPDAPPQKLGENEFFDAAQSQDGRSIGMLDQQGEVWLVRDGEAAPTGRRILRQHGATALALSADGSLLALADQHGATIWNTADLEKGIDVATARPRARVQSDGRHILDLALSPDGRWLAAGDLDQSARIWSAQDGRLVAVLRGHSGRIAGIGFSQDSRTLYTASWDGSARLWGMDVLTRPADAILSDAQAAWGLDRSGSRSGSAE